MVIWLIGMSASGKTTIGRKLYDKLTLSDKKWIFLDGDTFRNILGEDLGHTVEDRKKNAYRISRFCEFLSSQGINVVACVLSIFHDNQRYNKENITEYKEVYIDVDFDILIKRDNKELYINTVEVNELNSNKAPWENTILTDIEEGSDMYFVHSFIAQPRDSDNILSTTEYSSHHFCSSCKKDNIYGCQFHPEKSGPTGLKIINNFIRMCQL